MFQFLTIALFAISVNSVFSVVFAPPSTGGEIVAEIQDAPFVASLYLNNHLQCGAVIIHEYFVLTAATCLQSNNRNLYKIRAGSLTHNYRGTNHYVELLIIHPNFVAIEGDLLVDDIALIKVKQPFIFDGTRDAIPIYSSGFAKPGSIGRIFGWGKINSINPDQLRKGNVEIIDPIECQIDYNGHLRHSQICAKSYARSKVPCENDAGGPLVVGVHLIGIISWGKSCEFDRSSHVYTNVNYYRDWISRTVGW